MYEINRWILVMLYMTMCRYSYKKNEEERRNRSRMSLIFYCIHLILSFNTYHRCDWQRKKKQENVRLYYVSLYIYFVPLLASAKFWKYYRSGLVNENEYTYGAAVAQLVETWLGDQRVAGSSRPQYGSGLVPVHFLGYCWGAFEQGTEPCWWWK